MSAALEQKIDVVLLALFAIATAVALVRGARRGGVGGERRVVLATLALAAATFVVRRMLCEPTFLHANFRGARIVDEMLLFPKPAAEGLGQYGQLGFLVLGGVARLFGRSLATIATANEVVGVLTLAFAGWIAARWSGRAWCAPLAVVVGALQPALVRVAASEDLHGLAVLFGWIALVAIDVYATTKDRAALAVATLAAMMMVLTRQTLYLWALGVVGVALARGGFAILRRAEMTLATGLILATVALRIASTASDEALQLYLPAIMFSSGRMLLDLVLHHPLLDVARYALFLLPLELLGIVALRGTPMRRAYLILLAAYFVLTLPFGFPSPGVECAFRLPVLTLALIAGAAGAEWLVRGGWVQRALLFAAVASPIALPTWRALRDKTPQLLEYAYLQGAARELPQAMVLVELRTEEPRPSYRIPRHVLSEGRQVTWIDARELDGPPGLPVYFLAGAQCYAWSAAELGKVGGKGREVPFATLQDFFAAPVAHRVYHDVRAPKQMRPECDALLAHAEPVGEPLVIERPLSENPFILYPEGPIEVQLYRILAADALPGDAAP